MPFHARSILALDVSPFGRSLGLLPAIRALRATYPQTLLVAGAPSGTCELLVRTGLCDETIDLGVLKSSSVGGMPGGLKRLISLARQSSRHTFELVLDFSPRVETQVVSRLFLRAQTITPRKPPRAFEALLGLAGVHRPAEQSPMWDYGSVVTQAGGELKDTRFGVSASIDDNARFERLLSAGGSRGGELIVLLYASDAGDEKGWPVNAFVEIGTRLANNFGARIIVADQPADSAFTDAAGGLMPASSIRLARPGAFDLLAAVARASIVITDEAAIAKLAAELHTPVVEITDSTSRPPASSPAHSVVNGSSRRRAPVERVYEVACGIIQESRSESLFRRP